MQNKILYRVSPGTPSSSLNKPSHRKKTVSIQQSCTVATNDGIVERRKPLLVLTGQYQNGKSTFLNCLLGGFFAVEGNGTATTKYNAKYVYGDFCNTTILFPDGSSKSLSSHEGVFSCQDTLREMDRNVQLQISAYSPTLQGMDILDSPGCGANQQDDVVAEKALKTADFIIYVMRKTLDNQSDVCFLKSLSKQNKHFTIVLNCLDEVDPLSMHVSSICNEIMAKIKSAHLDRNYVALSEKSPVYPLNLLWAQCALGYLDPTSNAKKWSKVKCYLDQDSITSLSLLYRSNFLPIRKLLNSYVSAFFDYTPNSALSVFSILTNEWTSELVASLREKR